MPTLIITMGATGSGKSKLADKVLSLLKIKNFKYFLIDNYVENDKQYKKNILKFAKDKKNIYNSLKNPSKKTLKFFEKHYFETRNNGCKNKTRKLNIPNHKCIETISKSGCNKLMDIELNESIIKGENIIFEMKGDDYPKWLITAIRKCNKYKIVIAGVKVSLNNLIKRNMNRSIDDMKKFLNNTIKNSAPRLPDVSKKYLLNQKIKLNKTLKNIMLNGCIKGNKSNIDYCSKYNIDRLLIYDNNTSMKKIYDSKE